MNNLERINNYFDFKEVDRVPFVPAVYEHKAFLIDETPSNAAKNSEKLFRSAIKEYEIYEPDFITIGIDVYNIEAESVGAEVQYFNDNTVPVVRTALINDIDDLEFLKVPDPLKHGRMPLMLEASKMVLREIGDLVYIRGALSGPFSLASEIYGLEKLLFAVITEPDTVKVLLEFSCKVIKEYANAFIDIGLGVVVFDSRCAPPNLSPNLYSKLINPFHKELMDYLYDKGLKIRPLIIGGETTFLADLLEKTNSNLLLSDFNADFSLFTYNIKKKDIFVRRNINPAIVYRGNEEQIIKETEIVLDLNKKFKNLILGTGILPYDTPVENVLLIKKTIEGHFKN